MTPRTWKTVQFDRQVSHPFVDPTGLVLGFVRMDEMLKLVRRIGAELIVIRPQRVEIEVDNVALVAERDKRTRKRILRY